MSETDEYETDEYETDENENVNGRIFVTNPISNHATPNPITDDSTNNDEYKLTINDFRFSKIVLYSKLPPINKEQMLVRIIKTDPVYYTLSVLYHRSYIQHNIPQIPNSCPTIAQYWEELKVYRRELGDDGVYPVRNRRPRNSFFEEANLNFASSRNARIHKYNGTLVPIYYYHFNTEKNEPEFLNMKDAKKYFCREYERDIMSNEESKATFLLLLTLCKNRNKNFPVVIRGYANHDNMHTPIDIKKIYEDPKFEFSCEYCLVEMLIHYPNLNECIWNI